MLSPPFFDTNIVIDWLRRRPAAKEELARYPRHRVSRIVWTEVLAGEPEPARSVVAQLIEPFEVVEIDVHIAAAAAEIRNRTRMKLLDAFILATAQVSGTILVTRNTRDFPVDMPGVRIPYTL